MTADWIVILILAVLLIAALLYIRKQRKEGGPCMGCPHASRCAKKRQGGCGTGVQ